MNSLLDRDRLISLRLSQRKSQREIARAANVNPVLISNLESGRVRSDKELSLAVLERLAGALGVEPQVLLCSESTASGAAEACGSDDVPQDARLLGAILATVDQMVHRADLALGLNWEKTRVDSALRRLGSILVGSGMRLHQTWGVQLRPELSQVSDEQLQAVQQHSLKRVPLHAGTAELLRQVVDGQVDARFEANASNAERVNLARLVNLGLIRRRNHRFVLRDEVAFSLGLS